MSGRSIAFATAGIIVMVGVILFLNRGSSVSGKVYWEGQPIAAGQITFESQNHTFTAQINDGLYEVRQPELVGKFNVRIDIHFVDSSKATEFYENLTQELNPENRFDPQKDLEPGSQMDEEIEARKEAESKEDTFSSLKQFEFEEQFGKGWNSRDYFLPPDSD